MKDAIYFGQRDVHIEDRDMPVGDFSQYVLKPDAALDRQVYAVPSRSPRRSSA